MKNLTCLVLLLILPYSYTISQNTVLSPSFEVKSGAAYKEFDTWEKYYKTIDGGFVIMLKMQRETVHLQKFDSNSMQEVARKTYEDIPNYAKYQALEEVNGKLYFFYECYDKKEEFYRLYARQINTNDLSFFEPKEIIKTSGIVRKSPAFKDLSDATIATNMTLASPYAIRGEKFIIHKSQDASKILVHYINKDKKINNSINHDVMGFYVFDFEMTKLHGKEIELPYAESDMNNLSYSLTNNGDAFMLMANLKTKAFELLKINESGEEVIPVAIPLTSFIREIKMKENNRGNLLCIGYYSGGVEFKADLLGAGSIVYNANGIWYSELSPEGEVIKENNHEFSFEFMAQNISAREKEKLAKRENEGKAGILDLNITDYEFKENGDVFIIGETQYVERKFVISGGQDTYYFYSNVIMTKFNASGELIWQIKLPKDQYSANSGAADLGMAYLSNKNNDFVLFVDNEANVDLDINKGVPAEYKYKSDGYLTTYFIESQTGEIKRHTLMDLKNIPGDFKLKEFKTSRVINLGEGAFLVEINVKGKKDTMLKFKMK